MILRVLLGEASFVSLKNTTKSNVGLPSTIISKLKKLSVLCVLWGFVSKKYFFKFTQKL